MVSSVFGLSRPSIPPPVSSTPTYSLVPHASATARTQLTPTCGYARYAEIHPVQPLKGLRGTRSASVSYRASVPAGHGGRGVSQSYRALAPVGAGLPSAIEGRHSAHPQPTANYSLLTANSVNQCTEYSTARPDNPCLLNISDIPPAAPHISSDTHDPSCSR